MTTTGGDVVARMLRAEGVEVVFGIVDGSYFGLCEGLRQAGIRLVSPRLAPGVYERLMLRRMREPRGPDPRHLERDSARGSS
jgi:hypothetical protein